MIGKQGCSKHAVLQTPAHAMSVSVHYNKWAFSHPRVVHKERIGDKLMAGYSFSILEFQVWKVKATAATVSFVTLFAG